ncbi:MAG: protein-L-isoaspartate(D-aspartate) O-methyltransferase [Candidatus Neomarinimicrobiota bacterium]
MARNNLGEARRLMVESQIRRRGVSDTRVLQAMETVPRHQFVADDQQLFAYDDYPLPIGHRQTISQPYIVAYMTEKLQVGPQHSVLEIGTGCGYQAAVLSCLARTVTSVEIIPELAQAAQERLRKLGYSNVTVHRADGRNGWPAAAPFDRIITTAAAADIPTALIGQLASDGRMIIPVGATLFNQRLELVLKDAAGNVDFIPELAVRFVPLV